ncbi:RNA-binding protein [Geobacillus subterraneus]|uniref:RNA-binding protein n=2 Tax=Geobacillus TaxID=129337 RepID=A0ABN4NHL0_9BACL|nr:MULTISPECIES: YlxR family protein [Geobacillus]AMX84002.1 RNA-binding protein [Geobacillus subterraneus]KZS26794.1 RNA-binding protein [Geobacillus subterraneus]OXB88209.1 RNA-binding protein [Geobacillus uzenensis]QIZ67363.1 YlxR family protein [Geobacillus subterraneus]WPZ19551.1 YlxR family protein [Geobacillus subterraneus]
MAAQKKIPLRKCVVTGEMKPKREMVRIVRSKEGDVSIDPTGKKAGRGAYITLDPECILQAKKKNILARHLKAEIADALYEELLALAEKEKQAGYEK